ncbi:electron transport complex subunit RsxC [Candidatus Sororendozoicomonas aggregata]|uniref:electron transport complex subunit RsxC n=1 Tax=Candidatus Sororendozoicomonas aggregata TaxID=3073239 RepID=UPI002ED5423B
MSNTLIYPFPGGVHPPENKRQSTARPIATMPLCSTYYLPLNQHSGAQAQALVSVGEKVLKGQMLARAGSFVSAPAHAPTSGTITAIEPHKVPHPSGLMETCLVLESDGADRWVDLRPCPDYLACDAETLIERIHDAGVVGLGGAGFPAAVKMASRNEKKIHTLIVNGAECEPYITADDRLMRERARVIVEGIAIIDHLLSPGTVMIGIEDNKPEAIAAMNRACTGTPYRVVTVPTKYPSGDAQRLTYLLTGKEVPHDSRSVEMGVVCYNVGTLAAVHDAVVLGRPLISRVTTVTGKALAHPQNVEVLIGTPISELLAFAGLRPAALRNLVLGGPMMGFSLDSKEAPVIKTSNCFIAATEAEFPPAPPAQPCIRCGLCARACPCELLPQQLFWYAQAQNHEQLIHHNLFDCIECGACAYVCPSSIPLVQYYRASKDTIRQQETRHAKSDRAKQRFEFRHERLAREQAEKEARRKANAERAAKLKAQKAANPDKTPQTVSDDPVQAAIARAKAKKAAVANGAAHKAGKQTRSAKQKDINIQLSMAKAQLKKTERALAQAEAQALDSVHKIKTDVAMLREQVETLEKNSAALSGVGETSLEGTPETRRNAK